MIPLIYFDNKIEAKNCKIGATKNFILGHCTFALKMSLPNNMLCIDTKLINSSKMSKLENTPLKKVLRWAVYVVLVILS